jgi:hypothetical protein
MLENTAEIRLEETDILKLKCAYLELELLQSRMQNELLVAQTKQQETFRSLLSKYLPSGEDIGDFEFNLDSGCLTPKKDK